MTRLLLSWLEPSGLIVEVLVNLTNSVNVPIVRIDIKLSNLLYAWPLYKECCFSPLLIPKDTPFSLSNKYKQI